MIARPFGEDIEKEAKKSEQIPNLGDVRSNGPKETKNLVTRGRRGGAKLRSGGETNGSIGKKGRRQKKAGETTAHKL